MEPDVEEDKKMKELTEQMGAIDLRIKNAAIVQG